MTRFYFWYWVAFFFSFLILFFALKNCDPSSFSSINLMDIASAIVLRFGWFIALAGLCVFLFFLTKKVKAIKKNRLLAQKLSDSNKVMALQELESGNLDKLAWAKALEFAGGDDNKAKAKYITIRSK